MTNIMIRELLLKTVPIGFHSLESRLSIYTTNKNDYYQCTKGEILPTGILDSCSQIFMLNTLLPWKKNQINFIQDKIIFEILIK